MAKKKIFIPGGEYSDWALINAAHRLGLYVITSGTHPNAPGHKFSDEYVYADYSDKEAMLKIAMDHDIDYMCSCRNDFGMLSTAYVCEKLGLPGHDSYDTCWTLHHKDTFKPIAKKLGIHAPVSEIFTNKKEALDFLKESGRQMILKPSDNVGSRGVSTPKDASEFESAVDLAFSMSKEKKVIIEPYVEGFFVTVTSMIIDKKVEGFFANAYLEYPEGEVICDPFPCNERCTGFMMPAPYFDEYAPSIIEDFNKIAQELDLVDGKFHCELLVTPEHEAYIFDVHRRLSGFFEPWPEWNWTLDIPWEEWVLKAECGMDLSDFPKGIRQNRYLHGRNIFAPRDGIIKKMEFDEYLTSHMYPKFPGKNFSIENIFVTDYRHDPVVVSFPATGKGTLQFCFDTAAEAERISNPANDEFYKHITFEYQE